MEKVINTLYDIEEKANQILDRAAAEKAELNSQLTVEMKELDAKMEKKARDQLGRLKERMDAEVSNELSHLVEENKRQLSQVESHFNTCHTEMAEAIVAAIISG